MRTIVVYALYAWVAVSLLALVMQQVRRHRHRKLLASRIPAQNPQLATAAVRDRSLTAVGATTGRRTPPIIRTAPEPSPTTSSVSAVAEPTAPPAVPEPAAMQPPLPEPPISEPPISEPPRPEPTAMQPPLPEPPRPESPAASGPEVTQPEPVSEAAPQDRPTSTDPDTLKVPPVADAATTSLRDLPPPDVDLAATLPTAPAPMAPPETTPEPDLASLLAGIQLPCDLLPVIPDGIEPDDHHVSLITSAAPVHVVGPAMADELERLGYTLSPLSETELLAVREEDQLTLAMVVSPISAEHNGVRLYPVAVEGDVVITIETGHRSAPGG